MPLREAHGKVSQHRRGAPFMARRAINLHGCAYPSLRPTSFGLLHRIMRNVGDEGGQIMRL